MDFAPNDDHEALREAIRAVCRDFDKSYYVQRAEAGEPTTEAWKALGDHGFIGINMPEEYGGGGAGLTELAIVCEESAAAGVPQLLLLVSSAISGEVIANFGTQEQKEKWLPGMADGSKKVVFAITEPDAGTNSHRIATTAREVEGGWTLSGTKHFISGVDEADAVLVVARTGTNDATGGGELSLFIVETDALVSSATVSRCRWHCPRSSSPCSSTRCRSGRAASWARSERGSSRCSTGSTPNGSPEQRSVSESVGSRSSVRRTMPVSAVSGTCRSVRIKVSPTLLRRRRSRSSWPA